MGKSQYVIQFAGLPVGIHEFEFQVTEKFFQNNENSEIERAALDVKAILTKQNNLLQMHFEIEGTVGIECDRCLKSFDFPLSASEDLVIKHGLPEESTDEILVIGEKESEFDVSHYIYEYVLLAIPVRKVPCEIDEEQFECDYDTLNELNKISKDSENESAAVNPLWEELIKLKKNNKN